MSTKTDVEELVDITLRDRTQKLIAAAEMWIDKKNGYDDLRKISVESIEYKLRQAIQDYRRAKSGCP